MNISSVPFLTALILIFLPACAAVAGKHRPEHPPKLKPLIFLVIILGAWALVSSLASVTNYYDRGDFLVWLPGLWLPLVPIVIAVTFYLLSSSLRESLKRTLNGSPVYWHVLFQSLRLVSAGAIYKASLGEFPFYFAVFSGGLDFLYALSALWMAWRVKQGKATRTGLIIWNASGFSVLALTAPLLLQLGLPGSLQLLTEPPLSDVILEFPMALAPTFTGPLLIAMNALLIKHLLFDEKVALQVNN